MNSKLYMLNHQRQMMGAYGSQMNDASRAYNEMKLRLLEEEAYKELKRDLISSAREEMAKSNSENAKQFA